MSFENIGINIRNLREKENISQEKLAAKCNLSKQSIYLLEKGEFVIESILFEVIWTSLFVYAMIH